MFRPKAFVLGALAFLVSALAFLVGAQAFLVSALGAGWDDPSMDIYNECEPPSE